jgi:hypothetical protein
LACSLALLQAFVDSETRERASATLGDIRAEFQREPARKPSGERAQWCEGAGRRAGQGRGSAAPPGDLASRHQAIETASAQRRMQLRKERILETFLLESWLEQMPPRLDFQEGQVGSHAVQSSRRAGSNSPHSRETEGAQVTAPAARRHGRTC